MPKLSEAELLARDAQRDLNAELLESIAEMKAHANSSLVDFMRRSPLYEQDELVFERDHSLAKVHFGSTAEQTLARIWWVPDATH